MPGSLTEEMLLDGPSDDEGDSMHLQDDTHKNAQHDIEMQDLARQVQSMERRMINQNEPPQEQGHLESRLLETIDPYVLLSLAQERIRKEKGRGLYVGHRYVFQSRSLRNEWCKSWHHPNIEPFG
ncbi:unnamed protein product [Nippostrongylus brasiliensis]|uniref:DUF2052 domain-containing protein n=1 Tax=Nippostrongylus brasiliensis TaxID=27835 RepID=A0A0N4XQV1_NIPBR|nr:unnamed protein product [Nippostrongylus brasiliensis]